MKTFNVLIVIFALVLLAQSCASNQADEKEVSQNIKSDSVSTKLIHENGNNQTPTIKTSENERIKDHKLIEKQKETAINENAKIVNKNEQDRKDSSIIEYAIGEESALLPVMEAKEENAEIVWNNNNDGYFIDLRDHRKYKVVKIGNQIWMAENMAYLLKVCSGEEHCGYWVTEYYKNNLAEAKNTKEYKVFGALYSWKVANRICPPGWHLPSDFEWQQLELELGMPKDEAGEREYRGKGIGTILKSTTGWENNGNGTNKVGFNILPAGFRGGEFDYGFYFVDEFARFWTSTQYNDDSAWCRLLTNETTTVGRQPWSDWTGLSVRCVKDTE